MTAPTDHAIAKQHLIDSETCIRCNTCEETCPVDAITHDSLNYVVKFDVCNGCMDCVAPCPTGAIDSWRNVDQAKSYSLEEQYLWEELPETREFDNGVARPLRRRTGRWQSAH